MGVGVAQGFMSNRICLVTGVGDGTGASIRPVVLVDSRETPVELGARSEDLVEVLSGLELGQAIARRGAATNAVGGR